MEAAQAVAGLLVCPYARSYAAGIESEESQIPVGYFDMETYAILCGAPSWSVPHQRAGLSSMDYALVEFSQLDIDGIKRLATLHHSVMETLLSDLGLPLVLRYYQLAREDRSVVGICAVAPSGEMLGWAFGSPHPDLINSRLRTPFTWFFSQMLRVTLTRPLVLWQLLSSVLGSS